MLESLEWRFVCFGYRARDRIGCDRILSSLDLDFFYSILLYEFLTFT